MALYTVLAFVYYLRVAAVLFAEPTAEPTAALTMEAAGGLLGAASLTVGRTLVQGDTGRAISVATGALVAVLAAIALIAGFWPI